MVVFDTQPAVNAFCRVDDIGLFTLADSADRTFERAAAAFDAVSQDFINHAGLLKSIK